MIELISCSSYQGAVYDIRYPFIILTVLYLIGTLLAFFVPETLHQKLPDTLNEAKVFGLGQVTFINDVAVICYSNLYVFSEILELS